MTSHGKALDKKVKTHRWKKNVPREEKGGGDGGASLRHCLWKEEKGYACCGWPHCPGERASNDFCKWMVLSPSER